MKKLLLFAAFALGLNAQTAINDVLYLNSAAPWTGEITVSWPAFTHGSTPVAKGSRTVAVTAGVVSVSLFDSESASPSFLYTATFRATTGATKGTQWVETWSVPASPSVVTLASVRRTSTMQIYLSQIAPGAAIDGQVAVYNAATGQYEPRTVTGVGSDVTSVAGRTGAVVIAQSDIAGLVAALAAKEPGLGNPSVTDYCLTSNTSGVRAWKACGTGGGAVSSVFGRTGAVTAQPGDYAGTYEPVIAPGSPVQYWSGDKSWQSWPTFNQNTTGRAATATALAANGTNCSAGYHPLGVDASGNAEGCTADGTSGTPPYSCTVTATAGPLACTHNLSTTTPWVACYDGSGNMLGSTGASTSLTSIVATSSSVATITFSGLTTGVCVISTGSQGPNGTNGTNGTNGSNGAAATVAVGTVTTGAAGSSAAVTNVGTSAAAVFNITIPRGDTGANGSGTGDMLKSTYDPANVSGQVLKDAGSNGIPARTAAGMTVARTITGTTNRLTVTNGDGVAGNPTVDVDGATIAQKFFGTAAPGSVSGNLPGDGFTDTTNHNYYICNAPSGTSAPACTSVTAAGWKLVNSAGGATPTLSTAGIGFYDPFGRVAYATSSSLGSGGATYFYQFVCCGGVNLSTKTIGIGLNTGTSTSSVYIAAAIYADSAGAPSGSALGVTSGTTTLVGTAFMTFGSQVALTAGTVYWLAISNSAATVNIITDGATSAYGTPTGLSTQSGHPRSFLCASGGTGATTWASNVPTFPTTFCTSSSPVAYPAVWLLP